MQIKWLEDFVSLSRHRSLTRAAEERQVTLPAFGRRIKSLETWVGAPLLNRGTYPATLTPEGDIFLLACRETLTRLHETRAILRARSLAGDDTLSVATGRTIAHTLFPEILARAQRQMGAFNVRVSTGAAHDLALLLEEGSTDVLLGYYHPVIGLNLNESHHDSMVVARETLIPVCRPDASGKPQFPLPGGPRKPIPLLSYYPTLMMGNVLDWHLTEKADTYHLRRVLVADFAEGLLEHALQGVGIAWLPQRLVATALSSRRLLHAGLPADEIPLEVRLYRDLRHHKQLVDRLWQCLSESQAPPLNLGISS